MPTVAIRQLEIESVVAVMDNGRGASTWITQCPRPTSQVERIEHGQPRGSFWSAASNVDYPAMSAKPHEPSGINERLSCDHKTAFSLEPVEPPQGMQRT